MRKYIVRIFTDDPLATSHRRRIHTGNTAQHLTKSKIVPEFFLQVFAKCALNEYMTLRFKAPNLLHFRLSGSADPRHRGGTINPDAAFVFRTVHRWSPDTLTQNSVLVL